MLGAVALHAAEWLAAALFALWLVSLARRDASIVDPFWSTGFAGVAWVGLATCGGPSPRSWLVAALTTVWALRLSGHLFLRNRGHGEDFRYQAMRRRHGARFPLVSLFSVFLLQGAILWVVSLPLQVAMARGGGPLGWVDALGAALWAIGFAFEAVADRKLTRFRSDPANRGKVLRRGLWALTRHPNYFGDALLWWGLAAFALPLAPWTVVSPVLMTFLLVKVSGVALLEKDIAERRPEYRDYLKTTNAFLPGWRRRGLRVRVEQDSA